MCFIGATRTFTLLVMKENYNTIIITAIYLTLNELWKAMSAKLKNPAFSRRLVTAINQIINVLNAANASQFDQRSFQSKTRVSSVNQYWTLYYLSNLLKICSLVVDKRTKNNLYMHWVSVFTITYSSIETFAWIELTFSFDRNNSRSKQPSIELTRYERSVQAILSCQLEVHDIEGYLLYYQLVPDVQVGRVKEKSWGLIWCCINQSWNFCQKVWTNSHSQKRWIRLSVFCSQKVHMSVKEIPIL